MLKRYALLALFGLASPLAVAAEPGETGPTAGQSATGTGSLQAQPDSPPPALLLPAVQKVREAAARTRATQDDPATAPDLAAPATEPDPAANGRLVKSSRPVIRLDATPEDKPAGD